MRTRFRRHRTRTPLRSRLAARRRRSALSEERYRYSALQPNYWSVRLYDDAEEQADEWLASGGQDLLDSLGYAAPHFGEWIMDETSFRRFEREAEGIPGWDGGDFLYVDEFEDPDDALFELHSWGYR